MPRASDRVFLQPRANLLHRSHETIAALRDRLDAGKSAEGFTQCLAEQEDVDGQVAFFDEGVRPHPPDQFFLFDNAPMTFNQGQEGLEYLRSQRNSLAILVENAFR